MESGEGGGWRHGVGNGVLCRHCHCHCHCRCHAANHVHVWLTLLKSQIHVRSMKWP